MRKFLLLIVTVTLCLPAQAGHFATSVAHAQSLAVSLRVGDTKISFDGYTSPGAFISVKQNSAVVGTTVADAAGNFVKTIDAYNPGIQSYLIYSTDIHNLTTMAITYDVNLLGNTLTTISNIALSPTISYDPITSTFSGLTSPLSTLTLLLSDGTTYPVSVQSDGTWTFTLPTTLGPGTYTATATVTLPGNYISPASEAIVFTIISQSASTAAPASTTESVTSPSQNISATPTTTATPKSPSLRRRATSPSPAPRNLVPNPPASLSTLLVTVAQPVVTMLNLFLIILTISIVKYVIYLIKIFKEKHKRRK